MKAQSTIIQFIIFFMLGLVIFASTGSFFKYQSDLLKGKVASSSLQLFSNYISSLAVMEYDACKKCDYINMSTKISNTTADYLLQLSISQSGLSIATQPQSQSITSTLSNLIYSVTPSPSSVFSTQRITLTYDKIKNSIVIQ